MEHAKLTQEQQIKYSFSLFSGWSTENDGNRSHDYEIIAYDIKQIEEWIKGIYSIPNLGAQFDSNSPIDLMITYDATYDENNNEISNRDNVLDENGDLPDGLYDMTSYIDITGEELTKENYDYLKSGNYHTTVIDLTDKSN